MTGWVPDMDALVLRLLALDVPKVAWSANKRCVFHFILTIIYAGIKHGSHLIFTTSGCYQIHVYI